MMMTPKKGADEDASEKSTDFAAMAQTARESVGNLFDRVGVGMSFAVPGTPIRVGGGGSKQLAAPTPACQQKPATTEKTQTPGFFDSVGIGAGFTIPGTSLRVGGHGAKDLTSNSSSTETAPPAKEEETSLQSTITNGLGNFFDSVGLNVGYVVPGTSIVIGAGGSKNIRKT